MVKKDITTTASFVLLGIFVIYVTVRGLWRPLLVSLLYPWDVQLGSTANAGPLLGTAAQNLKTLQSQPGNTVAGAASGNASGAQNPNLLSPVLQNSYTVGNPKLSGLKSG